MRTLQQSGDRRTSLAIGAVAALSLSGMAAGQAAAQMPVMAMPAPSPAPAATRPVPPPVTRRVPTTRGPAAETAAKVEKAAPKARPDAAPNPPSAMTHAKPPEPMATMPGGVQRAPAPMAPMQGGRAPADARDSHDYSGGYRRSVMPGAEASDGVRLGAIFIEQFEAVETDQGSGSAWDVQAWYGGPFDKAWLRSQGDRRGGRTEAASVEALWFRMYHPFWGTQVGVRQDFGEGPNRTWASLGVQGVAPYWVATEATAYVGEDGRTAARVKIASDLRLTQRLVLRPDLEANLFGRSDPERQIGSGLSSAQLGLRLRYEIRREFAPYVGVAWNHGFGETKDLRRASSGSNDELQWVVGLQVWR